MITPHNPYYLQLSLLVRLLPYLGSEKCFGLKGGTAINLFYRDLPRYSVDIDLTYLPGETYALAQREIESALRRIAKALSSGSPSYRVSLGKGDSKGTVDTLTVGGADTQVKIEVNPVLRCTVHAIQERQVRPVVMKEFGFAAAQVLSFEDIYAGKIVAALDRQHPRDLFDVKLLLDGEGISDILFRTFLVYLVGHHKSIPDVLAPHEKDIEQIYREQFVRMTAEAVPLEVLVETRGRLMREIRTRLDDGLKCFLLSVQKAEPQWELLALDGVMDLPAVKWRLLNLRKMKPEAMAKEVARLENVFRNSTQ